MATSIIGVCRRLVRLWVLDSTGRPSVLAGESGRLPFAKDPPRKKTMHVRETHGYALYFRLSILFDICACADFLRALFLVLWAQACTSGIAHANTIVWLKWLLSCPGEAWVGRGPDLS